MISILFYFFRSSLPFIRSKSTATQLQRKLKRQPFVVLYVDQVCFISKDIDDFLFLISHKN
jgi:hypothetical protein